VEARLKRRRLANEWSANSEKSFENEARRLTEILDELGQIGKILEEFTTRLNPEAEREELLKQIALYMNRMKVPGFCGYTLAQEAFLLMQLLSVRITLLSRDQEKSQDAELATKLETARKTIDEAEPFLRQTIEEMEPWGEMNQERIIEAIIQRARARRKQ
jgi:hypothetical protein